MHSRTIIDLNDCTEFRQALRAHVPRVVHATALLLVAMLSAAVAWTALTQANLVVICQGRVRPISDPANCIDRFSREISSERDGRVTEVTVHEGDEVKAGAVLVRLDTAELDIRVDKLEQTIQAGRESLQQLDRTRELLTRRFTVAQEKAKAELDEVVAELDAAKQRQAADVQLARIALVAAQESARRCRDLASRGALSDEELSEAITRLRTAEEDRRKAEVPLNERTLDVLRQGLELTRRDYEVEQQKLVVERKKKQDEIDAASYDLAELRHDFLRSVIRAPADCVITRADLKVGDIVKCGPIGITTAAQCGFEFDVDVSSADVAHLRPGMQVHVKLDAYDHQKYGVLHGRVRCVSPDSTLKQLGQGGQIAVYNVKVALSGDELRRGNHRGRIKLGMTGRAEIVTEQESILRILVRNVRRKISLD